MQSVNYFVVCTPKLIFVPQQMQSFVEEDSKIYLKFYNTLLTDFTKIFL